jgi:hypothetical protein
MNDMSFVPPVGGETLRAIFRKDRPAHEGSEWHQGWLGCIVIGQSVQSSYKNAQDGLDCRLPGGVPVASEHDTSAIEHDIKILHGIKRVLEESLSKKSALDTGVPELSLTLDKSSGPVSCGWSDFGDAATPVQEVRRVYHPSRWPGLTCAHSSPHLSPVSCLSPEKILEPNF